MDSANLSAPEVPEALASFQYSYIDVEDPIIHCKSVLSSGQDLPENSVWNADQVWNVLITFSGHLVMGPQEILGRLLDVGVPLMTEVYSVRYLRNGRKVSCRTRENLSPGSTSC